MLADSTALQVEDEDSDLKRRSQQRHHNLRVVQDPITHAQEKANSPMVRLQHLLFTLMPSLMRRAGLSMSQTPYTFSVQSIIISVAHLTMDFI